MKNPGIISTSSNTSYNNKEEFIVTKTLKNVNVKKSDEIEENVESNTDTTSENELQNSKTKNKNEMMLIYIFNWLGG